MSKPSWDDAPSWATALAMDGSGWWYWYEETPVWSESERRWRYGGREATAKIPGLSASETLEVRND